MFKADQLQDDERRLHVNRLISLKVGRIIVIEYFNDVSPVAQLDFGADSLLNEGDIQAVNSLSAFEVLHVKGKDMLFDEIYERIFEFKRHRHVLDVCEDLLALGEVVDDFLFLARMLADRFDNFAQLDARRAI